MKERKLVQVKNESNSSPEYNFIYLIGESTTNNDIINETNNYFPETDLKKIKLLLLHTLVTFNQAKQLRESLVLNQCPFHSVKSILVPATEYDITRFIIRDYDKPTTFIRIRGGSWINAIAIADEVKRAKIITAPEGYFKLFDIRDIPDDWNLRCTFCNNLIPKRKVERFQRLYSDICMLICNNPNCVRYNQRTDAYTDNDLYTQDDSLENIDLIIYRDVPKNWNLKCLICNCEILRYKLVRTDNEVRAFSICNNNNCANFNNSTTAYTIAPPRKIYSCFNCKNELTICKVNILENENKLQLIYYCRDCNKDREFPIDYLSF
ncbi:MAG: hypothetical protein ACFFAN_05635 [Promethearchaeota archaeon]